MDLYFLKAYTCSVAQKPPTSILLVLRQLIIKYQLAAEKNIKVNLK